MLNMMLTHSPQIAAMASNKRYLGDEKNHAILHKMAWANFAKDRNAHQEHQGIRNRPQATAATKESQNVPGIASRS